MNFAVFNREKDLSTLADRLFVIEGGPAETAKAVAALLKANPHLSDLKKVPHGTLIVVPNSPDIPPVRVSETTDAGPETHKHLKLALKEFDNVIDRSLASEEEAVSAITETLKRRDLSEIASKFPEIKPKLKEFADAAKIRIKEAKANAEAEKDALHELQAALEKRTQL